MLSLRAASALRFHQGARHTNVRPRAPDPARLRNRPPEHGTLMFTITPAAAEQVLKAAKEGSAEGLPLRLAARRNRDGSIDYRMGFDAARADDLRFHSAGIEIIMAPDQVPLLDETTMDFVTLDDGNRHFIFLNPKDAHYRPPTDD